MSIDRKKELLEGQVVRITEAMSVLADQIAAISEALRTGLDADSEQPVPGESSQQHKSQFQRIAEALMAKGNKPKTANWIVKATGITRSSLSQILHRTHKDSFVSTLIPGYSRKKLWSLTEEAAKAAGQLVSPFTQPTLFGVEGDFSGKRGVDCCIRILKDHGGEAMNALTMAREAIARGYRGRAKGTEDEVLLTTAKSFWAALGRDTRFKEVRPLVFALKELGEADPP